MAKLQKKTGISRRVHLFGMAATLVRIRQTICFLPFKWIAEELQESNEASCDPPLPEKEVSEIAKIVKSGKSRPLPYEGLKV